MEHQARGKYGLLFAALKLTEGPRRELTFRQVEEIIGASLPRSARQYRGWWANEQERPAGRHTQARSWMLAEWRVESVDLAGEEVVFIRPVLRWTGPSTPELGEASAVCQATKEWEGAPALSARPGLAFSEGERGPWDRRLRNVGSALARLHRMIRFRSPLRRRF